MYDTYVTIVGNVLNEPSWRRTTNTKAKVTTFKVASTSRRYDRPTDAWVDGNSVRVRVSCWRALATNVLNSVTTGDPVIVTGRLYTRDWVDQETGAKRVAYELEASAVGHNLARGTATFHKPRREATATSATEEGDGELRAGGEATEPVRAEGDPDDLDRWSVEPPPDGSVAAAEPRPGEPAAVAGSRPGESAAADGPSPIVGDGVAADRDPASLAA